MQIKITDVKYYTVYKLGVGYPTLEVYGTRSVSTVYFKSYFNYCSCVLLYFC